MVRLVWIPWGLSAYEWWIERSCISQLADFSVCLLVTWVALDWFFLSRPKIDGACVGAVAGLVVITPCAGYIQPLNAIIVGVAAAVVCRGCVVFAKDIWGLDDATDVWGCHGCGGLLGTILTGLLADSAECGDIETAPDWCVNPGTITFSRKQAGVQFVAGIATAAYAVAVLLIIMEVHGVFIPWRTHEDVDDSFETGHYHEVDIPVPTSSAQS